MLPEQIKTIDGYVFTLSEDRTFYTDGDLTWDVKELVFYSNTHGLLGCDRIPFVASDEVSECECQGFQWLIKTTFAQVGNTTFCGTRFTPCECTQK